MKEKQSELEEEMKAWAARYGVPLEYLRETGSTNVAARAQSYPNGTILLAERQTAGRGQRGNRWLSAPGENLTFSVVLHPDFLPVSQQFYLSKAVSLALTDTLDELLAEARTTTPKEGAAGQPSVAEKPLPVSIKWPNDIYVGGNKIVGILIENDLSGEVFARSIVGIGLNVNQTVFPEELPNPTSLALETGSAWALTEVLGSFYRALSRRYDQLGRGLLDEIDRDYKARIYRLGQESRFALPASKSPFWGTITDVLPGGALEVLHREDGRKRHYLFKEIEYLLS